MNVHTTTAFGRRIDIHVHLADDLDEPQADVLERAIRLNPLYPVYYLFDLGHAYLLTGRYDEALAALKDCLSRNPDFLPARIYLTITYAELGREDEARSEAAAMLERSLLPTLEV